MLAIVAFCLFCAALTTQCVASEKLAVTCELVDNLSGKTFRVFEAFKYEGKPEFGELCVEPINVLYAWNFIRGPKHGDMTLPSTKALKRSIGRAREAGLVTVIDIEHWPLKGTTDAKALHSVQNYLFTLEQVKNALPDLTLGYYGVVPVRDFNRSRLSRENPLYRTWVEANNRVEPIAELVDATFPSLYTITPDTEDWQARAEAHISEARRLTGGKPVYPFIWPNYHPQGGKYPVGKEVDPDYWKIQLDFLRRHADGIVLWGGKNQKWEANMPWWQATVEFLETSFQRKPGIRNVDKP